MMIFAGVEVLKLDDLKDNFLRFVSCRKLN